jgi:predicted nucleotidyltransferase
MLSIEPKHLSIIKSILSKYNYQFYPFGSRVKGTNSKFSDLDLIYLENIPEVELDKIIEEFEESDLPFKIDILNYNKCDQTFKNIIDQTKLSSPITRIFS